MDGRDAVAATNGDSNSLSFRHSNSGTSAAAVGTGRRANWIDGHGVCEGRGGLDSVGLGG